MGLAASFWKITEGIGLDLLSSGIPYIILALGIFISYRVLDFADLGCEGSYTLGGAVAAVITTVVGKPYLGLVIALLCGTLAGVVTGLLATKLKIQPLLSGIITMTGLFTINLIIMGINYAKSSGEAFNFFTSNTNFVSISLSKRFYYGIYNFFHNTLGLSFVSPKMASILILIVIGLVIFGAIYYFFGTEIGMGLRATGMNPTMSRAQGINTTRMTILGLAISNGLISLSGALYSQVNGAASSTMGVGVLVIGLASIIIGEAIIGRKTFKQNLIAVIVGSLVYYFIIALIINTGILETHFLKLLYAIMIVLVLVITSFKKKRVTK